MAIAPNLSGLQLTDPHARPWPVCPGPSRPAATVLRFPSVAARLRRLTPVAPDPREGEFLRVSAFPNDVAAG